MADTPPRLTEQSDGTKVVRIPSSLAWVVLDAIEAALKKVPVVATYPEQFRDDIAGTTVVTITRQ